ncbi:MAG: hypothetical protein IJJ68_03695 [Prevotella sp.]|nr:hypothetical protein [Prevotella sp.]
MKQKLFTILTLLLCLCSTAWADDVTVGITTTTSSTSGATGTARTVSGADNLTVTHQLNSGTSGALSEYSSGNKGMYYASNSAIYSKGAYKWDKNTSSTEIITANNYIGYSVKVDDGYTYSLSNLSFGIAGSAAFTYKLVITDGSNTLYNGAETTVSNYNKSTSSGHSQNIDLSKNADVQGLTGTFYVRVYLKFNSTGKYLCFPTFTVTGTVGTASVDTESPVITTDLSEETYNTIVNSPVALSITAEHAKTYQWYSNDTKSTEGSTAIEGATTRTYNYTPTTTTTKYFYCVASNSDATGNKTATSKIATVTSTASSDASVKSDGVVVVANGTYKASNTGTAYTATIGGTTSAKVTITPNHSGAIVTSGSKTGAAGAAITVDATAGTQLAFSITAQDGTTTANYTLDITKAADKTATNNAYYLAVNEAIYGGQQIIGDDITMTFSDASNGTFKAATADASLSKKDANFVAATDGNGQNGSGSAISGTWYKFSPTENGILTIGGIINNDKNMYIYKNDKNTKITTGITYWANGDATFDDNYKASGKIYGLITINVEKDQNYYFSVGSSKMGFYGFKFVPLATETAVTVTNLNLTGSKDYATMYYGDRSLAVPAGVKAYTYKIVDDKLTISRTYENGGTYPVIPVGEAVVLEADNDTDTPYTFTVATTSTTVDADNLLKGTDTEVTVNATGYKYYKLSLNNAGNAVGFFFDNADGSVINNGAHKAYLRLATGGNARDFYLFNNETTGISNVNANDNFDANAPMFNLAGQKVNNSYKGVVIVNGKKMLNK